MSDTTATWILGGLLVFAGVMIGWLALEVWRFRRLVRERGWSVDTTRRRR